MLCTQIFQIESISSDKNREIDHRIMECPQLERTPKDHRVQDIRTSISDLMQLGRLLQDWETFIYLSQKIVTAERNLVIKGSGFLQNNNIQISN